MESRAQRIEIQEESVEATLEAIFQKAMLNQAQIQNIVIASEQGLVIAFKSKTKGDHMRLAALSPVLGDAGEAIFNALALTPLSEILLTGSEGTAYFARLKSAPAFLLVGANGQVNIGLLRLIAAEIETRAGNVLVQIVR